MEVDLNSINAFSAHSSEQLKTPDGAHSRTSPCTNTASPTRRHSKRARRKSWYDEGWCTWYDIIAPGINKQRPTIAGTDNHGRLRHIGQAELYCICIVVVPKNQLSEAICQLRLFRPKYPFCRASLRDLNAVATPNSVILWKRRLGLINNIRHALLGLERPICSTPLPAKCWSGMERSQADDGDRDHSTIEDQEVGLVIPKLAFEALPKFCNSENRSHDNRQCSQEQTSQEELHDHPLPRLHLVRVHVQHSFPAAPSKVSAGGEEGDQTDGLEKETSNHDVDACL